MDEETIFKEFVEALQKDVSEKSSLLIRDYYMALNERVAPMLEDSIPAGHNHDHCCDYEMRYSPKIAKQFCKEFLRSKGLKRDKWLDCCDKAGEGECECPHMKFVLANEDDVVIACY